MDYGDLNDPSASHLELEEFDIDDLPPSGEVDEEYDAINEETFGGDVPDFDEDLENIANQTADLELEEPSCSISAPDASQLPLPKATSIMNISSSTAEKEYGGFWGMGGFNGIKTLTEGLPGQNRTQQNAERYAEVAALEELAKSRGNTTYNSPWPIPSEYVTQQRTAQPFQQNAPMTLEELEKRLISESSHAMASNAAAAQLSQREMPFQMPPPSLDPHQRPPGLPPFIPPHILQMHMARMIAAGAIPRPPMPPFPGAFMPPFGMPPMHMQNRKMPFMRRDNHMGSPVLPPHLSEMGGPMGAFSPMHHRLGAVPGSISGSMTSLSSRQSRKNMPSCRTISDYAFDPYGGFMSKKEREWLIKIQLIQCMRTGDPLDDDYYYTQWKKHNVLQKLPNVKKIKPRYYNFEDTYPSAGYVPPSFSGSLGRPTHSSTSYPRQIIDVHGEADEEESTTGRVNTQKKLRALLLRIENAALLLLECEDLKRKAIDVNEEEKRDMLQTVDEKMSLLLTAAIGKDQLPMVMLIQKGRVFVSQFLLAAKTSQRVIVLTLLFETMPKYAKKIPDDSHNAAMVVAVINSVAEMDSVNLSSLCANLPFTQLRTLWSESVFAQVMALSFLAGISRNEWTIQLPPLMVDWLNTIDTSTNPRAIAELATEDRQILSQWLMRSNAADELAKTLALYIPQ